MIDIDDSIYWAILLPLLVGCFFLGRLLAKTIDRIRNGKSED